MRDELFIYAMIFLNAAAAVIEVMDIAFVGLNFGNVFVLAVEILMIYVWVSIGISSEDE